ncbi:pectinesterase inhibitor 3-like [Phoenix dactylifera]|uniref:Pectinesterase inhibitor 3-like n=1 Tax=Phoenix dactylifera TaxID=42345 RepID=A0A8B7MTC5_PHODC|nr:pectinesterase inhibitor 3-like [Phoenix dactylifera]
MATLLPHHHLLLLLSLAVAAFSAATPPSSLVISACAHARYPSLCVSTLVPTSPRSPTDLARAATAAAHSASCNASSAVRSIPLPAATPRGRAALRDCASLLSNAAGQLARAEAELRRLRPDTLRGQLDNAQTWASAAMTCQDTCLDSFRGIAGPTRDAVAGRVVQLSQLTSNALYLIARLASPQGRGR